MLLRMSEPEPVRVRPGADEAPPLFEAKPHAERSVFTAASLLREARRQRHLPDTRVPPICVLDPDGDLARHLQETGRARVDPTWACYHTTLMRFAFAEREVAIVPFAVGAPFAVLVAEELMASGCELLINLTSAGRIAAPPGVASFMVIERALRDEGTSFHYLPATRWSHLRPHLREKLSALHLPDGPPIVYGSTWTTDAPFRETAQDIERHRAAGVLAVEMEAAALYAFADAAGHNVICIAHLTNELGSEGDFEKGASDGAEDALRVLEAILGRLNEATTPT
jgi:uridine phosphorylase